MSCSAHREHMPKMVIVEGYAQQILPYWTDGATFHVLWAFSKTTSSAQKHVRTVLSKFKDNARQSRDQGTKLAAHQAPTYNSTIASRAWPHVQRASQHLSAYLAFLAHRSVEGVRVAQKEEHSS